MKPPLPRPRLRDRLRPLLRPAPGEAAYASAGRRAFWAVLGVVFVAGVALPYTQPGPMRRLDEALLGAPASPSPSSAPATATQALPPGTRFRDCRDDTCPWLVVLPAGRFVMGSPAGEEGRFDDEGPQHEVTIARKLAMMETEVTRGQFAAFVAETGYSVKGGCDWEKPGFDQTPQHPIVCVNWNDAQAYAKWLGQRTGQRYGLPSESEWEYAARAGSTTRYSFGDSEAELCAYARVFSCIGGNSGTSQVRSLKPNAWGLYDMHGNAWEWVQDCYKGYTNVPSDGASVEERNCGARLLRGGAWGNGPRIARAAFRFDFDPAFRDSITGLRLTRMLP